MCWNVRGLNSDSKWDFIWSKVIESKCDIVCLQETKKEHFDLSFIKNICPPSFDTFEYLPSVVASGGCITIWQSRKYTGVLAFSNDYGISVELTSTLTGLKRILSNIYAPCGHERNKPQFIEWLQNIDMPEEWDWLLVGDFNMIRGPQNRNKPGGNTTEMLMFNEAISSLGLVEIPLKGGKYTWSNKQRKSPSTKIRLVFHIYWLGDYLSRYNRSDTLKRHIRSCAMSYHIQHNSAYGRKISI